MVDIEPEWVHLATNDDGIQMNSYFVDSPDMVLGEMKMVSGPYGPEPTCAPFPDQPLGSLMCIRDRLGAPGRTQRFKHELPDILRVQPCGTQPNGDLTGGEVHRLHLCQSICICLLYTSSRA